ncbi:MAG TPA: response regulator [Planctomycetes bacterium]|nr:response regulator [Planctomycetota bacterium]
MMENTILIIEDEKLIIVSTQMVLEAAGYQVISAMNGEEGIKKAVDIKPDLILLDIMMPGIDGWETLTRLKRDDNTTDIPVIIFTAREHARGHQKSSEMGAAGYFRKPFEPDELIELVEKHVSGTTNV